MDGCIECKDCDTGDAVVVFCTSCSSYFCGVCAAAHCRRRATRGHSVVRICGECDTVECADYCSTCKHALCSVCAAAHKRQRVTRDHIIIASNEAKPVDRELEELNGDCHRLPPTTFAAGPLPAVLATNFSGPPLQGSSVACEVGITPGAKRAHSPSTPQSGASEVLHAEPLSSAAHSAAGDGAEPSKNSSATDSHEQQTNAVASGAGEPMSTVGNSQSGDVCTQEVPAPKKRCFVPKLPSASSAAVHGKTAATKAPPISAPSAPSGSAGGAAASAKSTSRGAAGRREGVAANSRGAGRTVQQIQGDREMAIALLDLRRLDEALAQLQGLRGEAHALNLARRGTGCVGDPAVVALLATLHRDLGRAYKERLELKEAKEYYKRASDLEAQARAADASHHARAGGSPAGPADRLPQGGGDGGGIPAGERHCSVAKGGGTQEHHRSSNGERTHVGHAPAATAAQQVPQRHSNGQRKGEGWRDVPRGVKSAGRSRSELGRVKLEKGRGGGTAGPPRASWDGPAPMKAPFKVGLREWAGGHPPGGWGSGQAGGWGNRVESGEGAGRNTFASPAGQRYGSEFDGRSCDWWGEAANWQADGLPPAVWGEQTWDSGADRGSWPRQQRGEPQPGPGHTAPKVGRVAIPLPRRR